MKTLHWPVVLLLLFLCIHPLAASAAKFALEFDVSLQTDQYQRLRADTQEVTDEYSKNLSLSADTTIWVGDFNDPKGAYANTVMDIGPWGYWTSMQAPWLKNYSYYGDRERAWPDADPVPAKPYYLISLANQLACRNQPSPDKDSHQFGILESVPLWREG